MPKILNLASFRKSAAYGQTVFPDRSLLIRQKLMENAENAKNCPFRRVFENLTGQTVLPYMSILNTSKIYVKCQNSNATF